MPPPIPSTDPMRIDILSAVPDLLQGPFSESIVGRARKAGVVEVEVHDIRKWTTDKHGKIDDTPFGGGAGMVMAIQPIVDAIADLKSQRTTTRSSTSRRTESVWANPG